MQNLLAQYPWLRMILVTIVSQIIWFCRYSQALFGKAYGKAIGMKQSDMELGNTKGMVWLLIVETITRLLYFFALWLLLQYVWVDHKRLIGVLYFVGVITTIITSTIWSGHRSSLIFITWWKLAIDLLIALALYWLL